MHKQLHWIILISLIISNTVTGVHKQHKSNQDSRLGNKVWSKVD